MSGAVAKRAVELHGARIEYLEAGAGATVVFFHGAGGVSPNPAFIPMMAERYRILLPSRPGFDGSIGEAQTVRDVAALMGSFVRTIAGGPVHLIAESAGGALACWQAILEPSVVESLVLVAPAAFHQRPSAGHEPPPGQGELEERLFGRSPAWSTPPTEEEVARRRKNSAYHMTRWQSEPDEELLRRLAEIQARTLVLWGTADRVIPPEQGELYQRSIPRSHLVYVYGAAHSLPVAAAEPFVRLVTEFIELGDTFVVNQDSTMEGPAV